MSELEELKNYLDGKSDKSVWADKIKKIYKTSENLDVSKIKEEKPNLGILYEKNFSMIPEIQIYDEIVSDYEDTLMEISEYDKTLCRLPNVLSHSLDCILKEPKFKSLESLHYADGLLVVESLSNYAVLITRKIIKNIDLIEINLSKFNSLVKFDNTQLSESQIKKIDEITKWVKTYKDKIG